MELENETKRKLIDLLLNSGMILLTIDTTIDGVKVPPDLMNERDVCLNLSRKFKNVNIIFGNHELKVTLTFNKKPFRCILPWKAIYSVHNYNTNTRTAFLDNFPGHGCNNKNENSRPILQLVKS